MVRSKPGLRDRPAVAIGARLAGDPDALLGSGFAFPDPLARLAGTPYAVTERVGRGRVVLFPDDPNFHLFRGGLTRLFLNAVLFAPSFWIRAGTPGPVRPKQPISASVRGSP